MRRVHRLEVLTLALVLATALPACAAYRKCGFAGCPGDARITAEVRALVRQHPSLEAPNTVHVQTLDHVVYLDGQVDTEVERSLAESIARGVAGVRRVVNSMNFSYEGR
jgi:osmotically-inducible protein OsmY